MTTFNHIEQYEKIWTDESPRGYPAVCPDGCGICAYWTNGHIHEHGCCHHSICVSNAHTRYAKKYQVYLRAVEEEKYAAAKLARAKAVARAKQRSEAAKKGWETRRANAKKIVKQPKVEYIPAKVVEQQRVTNKQGVR